MNCPVCRKPMVALEQDEVELDFCLSCHGVWVDATELHLLFASPTAAQAFQSQSTRTATREERRRCPICRQWMNKARPSASHPVTYDQCPRGHGFWFDDGELTAIIDHGHPGDAQNRFADFARSVFRTPTEPTQEDRA